MPRKKGQLGICFLFFADNLECSGERLWLSLLLKAKKQSKIVSIFLLDATKKQLERRYREHPAIVESIALAKEVDALEDVQLAVDQQNRDHVLFLDCTDKAFLQLPCDAVITKLRILAGLVSLYVILHH